MKKLLSILLGLCCLLQIAAAFEVGEFQLAWDGALLQAQKSLRQAPFGKKTVALLPIRGDRNGVLLGKLKNIVSNLGFTCVEGKEDPIWSQIIKEIAWDEKKDDILDPATVVKFGKLKAAQILLYGKIQAFNKTDTRTYAEIELHAVDLATKQHIWGGSFGYRQYQGKDVQGIVSLDPTLKKILKQSFEDAKKSIQSSAYTEKLKNIKTITVIPLAGDIDQYITGLTIEMLTQTKHLPLNPQIPALSQIRVLAKTKQLSSDAILYGAVRDLSIKNIQNKPQGKMLLSTNAVNADIQLFLEDVKTGNVLWSKSLILEETVNSGRLLTPDEAKKIRQKKMENISGDIQEELVDNWKEYAIIIGYVLGGIILLALIAIGIKVYLSYRTIR